MTMRRINVFEQVIRERNGKIYYIKKYRWAIKEIRTLKKEIAELKKENRQLRNENTPSSMVPPYLKPIMKSPNRLPVGTNPRGKPKGGNGGTKKIPKKIDKIKKVKFKKRELKQLKKKFGNKLKIEYVKLFPVWEIPPIKMIVTQYIVQRAYIGKKLIAQATHPDLPLRGIIGNRFRSWIISMKNGFAGSYEKITEHIEDLTGEEFSPQAIKDAVHRTGEELKPEYMKLERELRNSDVVGGDTSSWRVNGVNFFLWLFCTINIAYISIEKSKARNILVKILGNAFEGVYISDCASEFQKFAKRFQKCWSHLLRTTHTLALLNPKKDIAKLHEWLTSLFNEMSEFLGEDPPLDKRAKMFNYFDGKLRDIIKYKWKSEDAIRIMKNRLVKFRNDWCTAILIPNVKLTNNDTERLIRSAIPTRKLLGGHRTDEGAENYAITQSLRLTWKLKGLSSFHEMINKFREINNSMKIGC